MKTSILEMDDKRLNTFRFFAQNMFDQLFEHCSIFDCCLRDQIRKQCLTWAVTSASVHIPRICGTHFVKGYCLAVSQNNYFVLLFVGFVFRIVKNMRISFPGMILCVLLPEVESQDAGGV